MAWVQLLLLVLVAIALPGCEVVGGIFKAGAWVGALAVILVIAWLLGLVGTFSLGPILHLLLVVAVIVFIVGLVSGRRVLG